MTFKKYLLVLTVALVILLMGLLGTSYAYYGLTAPEEVKNNIKVEDEKVNVEPEFIVLYTFNDKINLVNGTVKNNFIVKKNDGDFTDKQVYVKILLEDIVSNELVDINCIHFQLSENNQIIASGIGSDFNNGVFTLKENSVVDYNKTYNYDLVVWYDGNNDLSNIENIFSARINVYTSVK